MGVCTTIEPSNDEVDSNYADMKTASTMLTGSRNAQSISLINMRQSSLETAILNSNHQRRLKSKGYKTYRIAIVKAYIHHIVQLLNNSQTDEDKIYYRISSTVSSTILKYFPLHFHMYGMGKYLTSNDETSNIERLHPFEQKIYSLNNIHRGHNRYFVKTHNSEIYAIGNNEFDGLCLNEDIDEKDGIYRFHHLHACYQYFNYVDQDQTIEFVSDSIYSNDIFIKLKNGSIYMSSLVMDDAGTWKRIFKQPQFEDLSLNEHLSITQIKCGLLHTLFLANNGTVYSFGKNDFGQCGLGYLSSKENAVQIITTFISENVRIKSIDCGQYHSLAVDFENNLWCFGSNECNQCSILNGMSDVNVVTKPTKVCFDYFEEMKSERIVKAECGQTFTVYLTESGYYGGFGKMIVSTLERMNIIIWETKGMHFRDLSCGFNHVLLIGEDDHVYTHGSNEFGKCGLLSRTGKTSTPYQLDPSIFDDLKPVGVKAGRHNSMIFFSSVSE